MSEINVNEQNEPDENVVNQDPEQDPAGTDEPGTGGAGEDPAEPTEPAGEEPEEDPEPGTPDKGKYPYGEKEQPIGNWLNPDPSRQYQTFTKSGPYAAPGKPE